MGKAPKKKYINAHISNIPNSILIKPDPFNEKQKAKNIDVKRDIVRT